MHITQHSITNTLKILLGWNPSSYDMKTPKIYRDQRLNLVMQYINHILCYLWWFSSTFSGDVANRKSHSWMTGDWSSSDARQSCVATAGCHATTFQRIYEQEQHNNAFHYILIFLATWRWLQHMHQFYISEFKMEQQLTKMKHMMKIEKRIMDILIINFKSCFLSLLYRTLNINKHKGKGKVVPVLN